MHFQGVLHVRSGTSRRRDSYVLRTGRETRGRLKQFAHDLPFRGSAARLNENNFLKASIYPSGLGRTLNLSGEPFLVIGIVSDRLGYPEELDLKTSGYLPRRPASAG